VRYRLRLPAITRWNDGAEHTEGGFTVNIALRGILIQSNKYPPVGSNVCVELVLPAPDSEKEEILIECVGRVVRVADQRSPGAFGVHGVFNEDLLTRFVWKQPKSFDNAEILLKSHDTL